MALLLTSILSLGVAADADGGVACNIGEIFRFIGCRDLEGEALWCSVMYTPIGLLKGKRR